MPKLIIEGIAPYDGEYELDSSYFTFRERHTIKRISGARGAEIVDALEAGDSDVVMALAVIAISRTGTQPDENMLWDGRGTVRLEMEDEPVPPDKAGTPDPGEQSESSGDASKQSSDPTENDQSPTGLEHLATGAASGSAISPT